MEQTVILGAGKIGLAIARGLKRAGVKNLLLCHHREEALAPLREQGFEATTDHAAACASGGLLLLCVQPAQAYGLVEQLAPRLDSAKHTLVSVVTGLGISELATGAPGIPLALAMPNTAAELGESMTCLAGRDPEALQKTQQLFDHLGTTQLIDEDQMTQATALCACGVAFFLRAIRAASQGGTEIGFHAEDAIVMAAQTARGAASLLLERSSHPEHEIDRVTTPKGCTIAGLNRMEHQGFSSALIHGIITSARKAAPDKAGTNE